MTTLAEIMPTLAAPFTAGAVKWKVQAAPKDGRSGVAVAFIDARLVAERLNHAVGGDWSSVMRPGPAVPQSQAGCWSVVCTLTVLGAVREDVGYGTHFNDAEVAVKAAYSDALKRAAVQFGIGASLYALPTVYIEPADLNRAGKSLTRDAERRLRGRYADWVQNPAVVERFGKPIAHSEIQPSAEASAPVGAEQ